MTKLPLTPLPWDCSVLSEISFTKKKKKRTNFSVRPGLDFATAKTNCTAKLCLSNPTYLWCSESPGTSCADSTLAVLLLVHNCLSNMVPLPPPPALGGSLTLCVLSKASGFSCDNSWLFCLFALIPNTAIFRYENTPLVGWHKVTARWGVGVLSRTTGSGFSAAKQDKCQH